MRALSPRLILRVVATLSWVMAALWFITDPGFEPLIGFIAGLAALLGSFTAPDGRSKTPQTQIDELRTIEASLERLMTFVHNQRRRMQEAGATLAGLEREKAELEPVVSASRETVQAVLELYTRRGNLNVRRERLYGFLIGVFSSILASLIYEFIAGWITTR